MAEISTSGLEELLSDMEAIAEIPDAVILEMLAAEAGVIAPAQAAEARAMGVVDTGKTAGSITFDKKLKATKDGKAIYVYPKGSRSARETVYQHSKREKGRRGRKSGGGGLR